MNKAFVFLITALIPAMAAGQELEGPSLTDHAGPTMRKVMRGIIIPNLEFKDTSLEDAVEFLRYQSIELDTNTPDPGKKGINVIVKAPPGWSAGAVSLDDDKAF